MPPVDAASRPRARKNDQPEAGDGSLNYSLDQLDAMDRAFVERMLGAIEAGLEHCPIGVNTTQSTIKQSSLEPADWVRP